MARKKSEEVMTPATYFDTIKHMQETTTSKPFIAALEAAKKQLKKFQILKQADAEERYMAYIRMLEKEAAAIEAGFNQYVEKSTIQKYTELVKDKSVYVCELSEFPRDVPDEVFDKIADHMDLFDHLYVVFTDYTQTVSKEIEQSRREKDPILFGAFDLANRGRGAFMLGPRWYFIGDWVDEYCDLTLSKMIEKFDTEHVDIEVVKNAKIPTTQKDLVKESEEFNKSVVNNAKITIQMGAPSNEDIDKNE